MDNDRRYGMRPSKTPESIVEEGDGGITICRPSEADEFMTDENVFILESWRSPLDPAMSIARGRVQAGATSVAHRLDGIDERYIIVAGRGRLPVPGLGHREVGPGDIVFFPAGQPQTITNTGDTDLLLYAICTPPFDADRYVEVPEPGT